MDGPDVLVVDDERSCTEYLSLTLRQSGYRVRCAGNGVEALLAIESEVPDLVVSDLRMPVMDGVELLRHVKQRWPAVPVIIVSAFQDIRTVVETVQLGAINYLIKPAPPAVILPAVEKALQTAVLNAPSSGGISEIVGASAALVRVRHLVALAAHSDVNVLITGRTGTGKELVARAIHRYSSLAGKPFVGHNCAATPAELFESQFFGHLRGAFTGADRDQTGLLQQADGGVLFLDELASLGPAHQAKLLRVLDDGEIRPLGANAPRLVSVRFLAAVNCDPVKLMESGSLREDLYYRLRGFEIHLPELRERPEDIPLLVGHFLAGRAKDLTAETLQALRAYAWPGNVRELRNVLRAALSLAGDGKIQPDHLPLGASPSQPPSHPLDQDRTPQVDFPLDSSATLKEHERRAIIQALSEERGNRSRAARTLGIHRSTLRRKMREFGVPEVD